MPTTYTHDAFGKKVYQLLPEEIQEKIRKYKMAYFIGLHGPDLLFYYKPIRENAVNKRGHEMHQEDAKDFFLECRRKYKITGNEEILVYTIGVICHYMLDSTCHPYISRYMEKTGCGHDEIETDLDRTVMERHGKNPFFYRPANHLKPGRETIETIASVYDGISARQIRKCLKGMRFYTSVMVCRTPLKRKLILGFLRVIGVYEETQGRMMRRHHLKRCEEGTKELISMIRCTIPETVSVIEEFYRTLNEPEEISYRFFRNYV